MRVNRHGKLITSRSKYWRNTSHQITTKKSDSHVHQDTQSLMAEKDRKQMKPNEPKNQKIERQRFRQQAKHVRFVLI